MKKTKPITGTTGDVQKQETKLRVQTHEYSTGKMTSQTYGGIILNPTDEQITQFCDVLGHFNLGKINTVTKIIETTIIDNKLDEKE
ncbi:hypothetical protein AN639_11750 [Candidatus Epulonipiscium fishelsonii]|uniref:Uncharacterized protein n=1 Tax=Candidatus Epulonipiscium fishelsonii TaxID=77094 RepID=A0ACC8XD11_9FIRM|nr:hypothetical protein AN396_05305 [Epulopiscium sp. SCG-B11WGA-EpuloA1]ONI42944.1 hypothetical protein AN639_11750 [Epulopiscium sp. SCG-B05WGA-EpuloA1]ONI48393.1 hypothetical protein AN643_01650 [Epulopiscium sp. SCG-B10WGA-EpuloB]